MTIRKKSSEDNVYEHITPGRFLFLLKKRGTIDVAPMDEDGQPDRGFIFEVCSGSQQVAESYTQLRDESPINKICLVN